MEQVRKRFIRSIVADLIDAYGREAAAARLQKAARSSSGAQRRLTLDMVEAIESWEAFPAEPNLTVAGQDIAQARPYQG